MGYYQLLDDLVVKLDRIKSVLDKAPRSGSEKDDPEGSRTIIISDTLAKAISLDLSQIIEKIDNMY